MTHNTVVWNNQSLEPILITFNRAKQLEATLSAFFDAGLTTMRLHVLDNASTDHTRDIVQQFKKKWPALQYHRNSYNIGGNANILRAIEISQSEYHWCIGDDDQWFLEDVSELSEVLAMAQADVIRLGWQVADHSRGQLLPCRSLIEQETMFFGSVSMISATIVRRSCITSALRHAYQNISNFYPQLIPIIRGVDQLSVYTLNKDLMVHTPSTEPGSFVGDLEWYCVWYKTGVFFNEGQLRQRFNQETLHYIRYISRYKVTRVPVWLFLIRLLLTFKSLGISQTRYISEVFLYGQGVRKAFILPAIFYFLTPSFVAKGLRELYRKLYKLPSKQIVRDESR